MTIEEAIVQCEDRTLADCLECLECAEDHGQLTKWLHKLKEYEDTELRTDEIEE